MKGQPANDIARKTYQFGDYLSVTKYEESSTLKISFNSQF